MSNLASTLGGQGNHAGARSLQEEALTVSRRVLGAEHPDTLISMNKFCGWPFHLDEIEAARSLVAEVLPIALGKYGTKPHFSKTLIHTATRLGVLPPLDAQPQS